MLQFIHSPDRVQILSCLQHETVFTALRYPNHVTVLTYLDEVKVLTCPDLVAASRKNRVYGHLSDTARSDGKREWVSRLLLWLAGSRGHLPLFLTRPATYRLKHLRRCCGSRCALCCRWWWASAGERCPCAASAGVRSARSTSG